MEFTTDPIFEALRRPLALIDDEGRREAIDRYLEAARSPLERAAFDLLAGLVAAVNEQAGGAVRLRLAYRPGALELEVEARPEGTQAAPPPGDWIAADGDMEKVTIRIPAELKDLATEAANRAGLSANSWFVRALAGALRGAIEDIDRSSRGRSATRPGGELVRSDERRDKGRRLQGWIGE